MTNIITHSDDNHHSTLVVGASERVDLTDLYVHAYYCERCIKTVFVDVAIAHPQICRHCGATQERISAEAFCWEQLA